MINFKLTYPFIGGHKSFLWGHWCPCFGLLVTSVPGFKARVGLLICLLHYLPATHSSDSPLVWHLLMSWQLSMAWQPSCFQSMYLYKYKHRVGLEFWIKIPLPYSVWHDRRSTEWGMPVRRHIHILFSQNFQKLFTVVVGTALPGRLPQCIILLNLHGR